MTISIKSIGGMMNEPPTVSGLKAVEVDTYFIKIQYTIHDLEMTYCRQYLILNGEKTEITTKGTEIETDTFEYLIDKLDDGTNYNIQIEASDGHDVAKSDNLSVKTLRNYIYGIKVNDLNSNPETACEYIEDSVGIQVATKTSLGGWENRWPYNKIRIVGFKDGKVVKEIKKGNKKQYIDGTTVPTDVDVMVEIPKIYWKVTEIKNSNVFDGYELRVSNIKVDDSYDCYAHKVNGVERDYIYIGAYIASLEDNRLLRSISGRTPLYYTGDSPSNGMNRGKVRNFAHAVGKGYQEWNWTSLVLIRILFLLAYKNRNSKSVLGPGISSSRSTTGGSDKKGFIYGGTSNEQICFLGIEDLWGNGKVILDGIYSVFTYSTQSNTAFYINTTNNFLSDTSNYKRLATLYKSEFDVNGPAYITKVNRTNEGLFFPKSAYGSSSTGYTDALSCSAGGNDNNRMVLSGGIGVGIFNLYEHGNDGSWQDFYSRLVYLGE